jgi:Family of unknown function (DUF5990)
MTAISNKSIRLRLACKTMPATPPTDEALDVGIQDKAQAVHAARTTRDGTIYFECAVEARIDGLSKELDFRGPFVHGTPQSRFLYVSWKRRTLSPAPWFWRIKIPLAGITAKDVMSLKAAEALVADIAKRRPHATDAIIWKRGVASEA